MSLKNLKSLYDRHTYNSLGNTPENSSPSDGMYFTDKGTNDSPFISRNSNPNSRGGSDHMVDLLTKVVYSPNSDTSYNPSPNQNSNSDYQDLDGADGGQGYFQLERSVASKKHIDSLTKTSTYTHGNSTEVIGPVPGGANQNSPFNDIEGDIVKNTGPSFGDASGEGKKLGGVDLHVGLLTKGYTYSHAPGFSTTVLGENERGHAGGKFDLDNNDAGQGFFHGIANPGRYQGKQLGGVDLHEALLTKSHTYSHGGGSRIGTTPVTIGPSPGPSGFSDFQDLDGNGFGNVITTGRHSKNFGGPYKTTGPTDGFY